ncbi:MAG: MBL fold metallo-hydrolase [Bacilli bacterium]
MVKVFRYDEDQKEFSANTYVLGKIGGNCLIVDLGSTNPEVSHYIDTHYEKCVGILLTHAHMDHIRGISALLKHYKDYDIPVYMSEDDYDLLTDSALQPRGLPGDYVKPRIAPNFVKDGDIIAIKDYKIKVIATPFHTKGSVCYLFDDDNALFSGDTLFPGSIGRTDLPTSEPEKVNSSLKKLTGLRDTLVVYPGHGSLTRLGDEKKINPYLRGL